MIWDVGIEIFQECVLMRSTHLKQSSGTIFETLRIEEGGGLDKYKGFSLHIRKVIIHKNCEEKWLLLQNFISEKSCCPLFDEEK